MEAIRSLDPGFSANPNQNTQSAKKLESQNDNDTSSGGGGEDAVSVNIRRGVRDEPSAYSLAGSLKERINTRSAEAVAAQPVPSERVVSALTEA